MWADSGYDGAPLARYAKAAAGITVEVVKRTAPHSFQVLRRRWVIERTFGWLMRYRRLVRDYERTTANSEAMIYWATILIMTRRLARYETGQPQPERWGGERPRPAQQAALSTGSKLDSVGDLGNRRRVAVEDRLVASRRDRHRLADAAVRAGDHGRLAGQPARAPVAFLAVVGNRIHLPLGARRLLLLLWLAHNNSSGL
jgi:Transposase DDE domain